MSIYPSDRVLPYVYWLTNRESGQFYVGSRTTMKLSTPSHLDLPQYQTSSDHVKELGFENFDWFIVAEFFNGDDAYWHEQKLIKEHINNPLCLNKHFVDPDLGSRKFGGPISDTTKAKMSAAKLGRRHSNEHTVNKVAAVSQQWIIVHPDGSEETIKNLNEFCRMNDLDSTHLAKVAKGKRRQHKGYRCFKRVS